MKKPFSPNRVEYGLETNEIDELFLTVPFNRYDRRIDKIHSDKGYTVWDVMTNRDVINELSSHVAIQIMTALNDEHNFYVNNLYAFLQDKEYTPIYNL
jgi:hypothetical protein